MSDKLLIAGRRQQAKVFRQSDILPIRAEVAELVDAHV